MFKGETEILVRNKHTLEINRTIKQKNSMTLMALHNLFINEGDISWNAGLNSNTFFNSGSRTMLGHANTSGGGSNLGEGFICVARVDPNTIINEASFMFLASEKTGDYVRSQPISGEDQPVGTIDLNNKTAELTFKGRVEPPSSAVREINCVQVGYVGTLPNWRNHPGFAVVLDAPCLQTDEEILDVFYRVSIVANNKDPEDVLWKTLFLSRLFPFYYDSFLGGSLFGSTANRNYDVTDARFFGYKLAPARKVIRTRIDNSSDTSSITTNDKNFSQLTGRYSYSYNRESDIGNTYSSVYAFTNRSPFGNYLNLGNSDRATRSHMQQLFPQDINPIQSVFKHSPIAIRPYLDPSFLGSSTADVILNGEDFELDSSNVYKIVYTTGGNINSAEYGLEKKMTLGYRIGDGEYIGEAGSSKPMMTLPGHEISNANPSTYWERSQVNQPNDGVTVQGNDLLHYRRGLDEWILFPTIQKYDDIHVICADAFGLNVLNVYTDDYVNYDEWSTPQLEVTGLTDYCVDNNKTIWAASKNEGLFKIDHENGTIEKIEFTIAGVNQNQCYSVDFKNNGDIWAVFEGAIARSQDDGNTWEAFNESTATQFSVPGVTDINAWNQILGIVIDKQSADDRILLVFNNVDTIGWWSSAGSTTGSDFLDSGVLVDRDTQNRLGYIRTYNSGFPVRKWIKHFPDTDTFVLLNNFRWSNTTTNRDGLDNLLKTIDFGATSLKATANSDSSTHWERYRIKNLAFERDSTGTLRLVNVRNTVRSSGNDDRIGVFLLDENLNTIETVADYGVVGITTTGSAFNITVYNQFFIENMGGGVALLARLGLCYLVHYIANSEPDGGPARQIVWQQYGWNGSEWELDHPGSRPVHETEENLIDGLTIRFEPGGTPQFVQDEYVTAYVFRGVHKDNATSLSFNSAYHLRPTLNLEDVSPSSVPLTPKGLVENKRLDFNTHTNLTFDEYRQNYQVQGMSGCATANTNITRILHSELKFEGDFSVSFKTSKTGRADDNARATFGITPVSTLSLVASWLDAQYGWQFFRFNRNAFTGTALTGSAITVVPTDNTWAGDEVFTLERVGTEIYYKINGTTVHTETGASTEPMVVVTAFRIENFRTFYDMNIDYYTENRRIVELGNSTQQTGVFDPDFAMVEAWLTPRTCRVTVDGQEAPLIVDTLQDPQAGQVTLLPKTGWLVFDNADEGLNITARYQAMYAIQTS